MTVQVHQKRLIVRMKNNRLYFILFSTSLFIFILFCFCFSIFVRCSSYWGRSLQNRLRDVWTCGMTLASALYAVLFVCHIVTTSDDRKKSEMGMSPDWYVTVEHWRSSLIRIIFIDYLTSELQCNY